MNTTVECAQTLLVQAEFDGELGAAEAAALVQHREGCVQCQATLALLADSRALLRQAPRHDLSPQWHADIRRRMLLDVQQPVQAAKRGEPGPEEGRSGAWRWRTGWGAALVASVLAAVLFVRTGSADFDAQLVDNHLRALQSDAHLIDVVSTDHHTIRPWFAGKLSFAPPVKQLDTEGYVLKGGRVDILAAQPVAVLVYQAGRHLVDVYIRPREGAAQALQQSKQQSGFNLRHWQEGDFEIWCVSDLGAVELQRFVDRWHAAG